MAAYLRPGRGVDKAGGDTQRQCKHTCTIGV